MRNVVNDLLPNSVLTLLAPTACGKTDLMVRLAQRYPIEVVSVDSAMVYKELSIGANKLTSQELAICPHHLVDVTTLEEGYDVGRFFEQSAQAITDILQRGKIPVLVGGTMMYVHQIQQGLAFLPDIPSEQRQKFWEEFQSQPLAQRYTELQHYDPLLAERLPPTDKQRIYRGLEVWHFTGKKLTDFWAEPAQHYPYALSTHGFAASSKEEHRDRILQRASAMIEAGFIAEVEALKQSHNSVNYDFWSFVGYRQVRAFVDGHLPHSDLISAIDKSTWQLVKRQKTWLRKGNIPQWEIEISTGRVDTKFINIFEKYCSFVLEKGISRIE